MSDDTNITPANDNGSDNGAPSGGAAATVVDAITGLEKSLTESNEQTEKRFASLEEKLEKAAQVVYPNGAPNGSGEGVHGVRTGESPMTSRPYSLISLAKRIRMQKLNIPGFADIAKPEVELSNDLSKAYGNVSWNGWNSSDIVIPLSADLMPMQDTVTEEGHEVAAIPAELRKRCRDMMDLGGSADIEELEWLQKNLGIQMLKGGTYQVIRKDMSHQNATTGGTLVAAAAQGELINILRAQEVWTQVGAQMIDLPPQGSIRFPRITSTVTVSATSEAATISESTPGTGHLLLQAKPYVTLVDVPEELFKFSSVAVEAWLRTEMTRETALKTDRDTFNGAGGTAIQGLINTTGVEPVTASTTEANGDTLDPEDPMRLYAAIADNNAPVDRGFFYAMTNTLYAGLKTRKASTGGDFMFESTFMALGGGRPAKSISGEQVIASTQVPTDRTKGAGTTLTMLFGGVGSEVYIARSGVMTIDMTNSDGTKFQQRLSTLRSTMYTDAGPLHEESFGYIDDLVNA